MVSDHSLLPGAILSMDLSYTPYMTETDLYHFIAQFQLGVLATVAET